MKIESPAITPSDTEIVKILLVTDFNRAVKQKLAIRPDTGIVSEFGSRLSLVIVCHLGFLHLALCRSGEIPIWLPAFFLIGHLTRIVRFAVR
jgi:hypothetical protein